MHIHPRIAANASSESTTSPEPQNPSDIPKQIPPETLHSSKATQTPQGQHAGNIWMATSNPSWIHQDPWTRISAFIPQGLIAQQPQKSLRNGESPEEQSHQEEITAFQLWGHSVFLLPPCGKGENQEPEFSATGRLPRAHCSF